VVAQAARPASSDPRWEVLKQRLPRSVSSLLLEARLSPGSEGAIRIDFRYPAHLELMQRADKKEMLARAVREVFGESMRVELGNEQKPAEVKASSTPSRSIADDPVVKDAMNRFDAVNVRVVPKAR
jgi:hypothetical protein